MQDRVLLLVVVVGIEGDAYVGQKWHKSPLVRKDDYIVMLVVR
jgi:hypothetical protein